MGQQVEGKTVRCRCDNAAVVAILNLGSSKDEHAMHLLRSLFLFLARHDISIFAKHIAGVENGPADALSRNNHQSFLSHAGTSSQAGTINNPRGAQASFLNQPDWTSRSWTSLLRGFLERAWRSPPNAHTAVAKTDS